jgi:hypothetical protein
MSALVQPTRIVVLKPSVDQGQMSQTSASSSVAADNAAAPPALSRSGIRAPNRGSAKRRPAASCVRISSHDSAHRSRTGPIRVSMRALPVAREPPAKAPTSP